MYKKNNRKSGRFIKKKWNFLEDHASSESTCVELNGHTRLNKALQLRGVFEKTLRRILHWSKSSYMNDSLGFDLCSLFAWFLSLGWIKTPRAALPLCAAAPLCPPVPGELQGFLTNPGCIHVMTSSEVWIRSGGKLEAFSYEGKTSKRAKFIKNVH